MHSVEKRSGKEKKLLPQQVRFLVGWILEENAKNIPVHLQDCIVFLERTYGVTLSPGTMHKYLTDNGFSSQVMQHRTQGYKLNHDDLARMGCGLHHCGEEEQYLPIR